MHRVLSKIFNGDSCLLLNEYVNIIIYSDANNLAQDTGSQSL